jgi:hypothetical protein
MLLVISEFLSQGNLLIPFHGFVKLPRFSKTAKILFDVREQKP